MSEKKEKIGESTNRFDFGTGSNFSSAFIGSTVSGGNNQFGNQNQMTNNFGNRQQELFKENYQEALEKIEDEIDLSSFNLEYPLSENDQLVLKKLAVFIATKEIFINYRGNTIRCLDELWSKLSAKVQSARLINIASAIDISGKVMQTTPIAGEAAEISTGIISNIINLANSIKQRRDLKKYVNESKEAIVKDISNLRLFEEVYQSLQNIILPIKEEERSDVVDFIVDNINLKESPFIKDPFLIGNVRKEKFTALDIDKLEAFTNELFNNLETFKSDLAEEIIKLNRHNLLQVTIQQDELLEQTQEHKSLH